MTRGRYLHFPPEVPLTASATELIKGLICRRENRLGSHGAGAAELRAQPFFAGVDFDALRSPGSAPYVPFKPDVASSTDARHFPGVEPAPEESEDEPALSTRPYDALFAGFGYRRPPNPPHSLIGATSPDGADGTRERAGSISGGSDDGSPSTRPSPYLRTGTKHPAAAPEGGKGGQRADARVRAAVDSLCGLCRRLVARLMSGCGPRSTHRRSHTLVVERTAGDEPSAMVAAPATPPMRAVIEQRI